MHSHEGTTLSSVVDAIRASARHALPPRIEAHHRLVDDLGYDSLGIVHLSVALEDRLGHPVLLDGWIGSAAGPSALTVGSLATYLSTHTLEGDDGTAVDAA